MRSPQRSWRFLLAWLTTGGPVWACTVVSVIPDVGPNVSLQINGENSQVIVRGEDKEMVVTSKNGIAALQGLSPGTYLAISTDKSGQRAEAVFTVRPQISATSPIALTKSGQQSIAVRALRGTLRGPDFTPGLPQAPLSLQLLDARTGKTVETTKTNSKGEFAFLGDVSKHYELRISPFPLLNWPAEQVSGTILVSLSPNASEAYLDLDLGWSSCGLSYAQVDTAQHTILPTQQLAGRVVDGAGAPIPQARIGLLDASGKRVVPGESARETDNDGRFSIGPLLPGLYTLHVQFRGFNPLRRHLIVSAASALPNTQKSNTQKSNTQSLLVQLGVGNNASTLLQP